MTNFEDVFSTLGGYSKRQVLVVILVAYTGLPNALVELNIILTQAEPDHRCEIVTLENSSEYYEISEQNLTFLAIPEINGNCNTTNYDQCFMYDIDWEYDCGGGICTETELVEISEKSKTMEEEFGNTTVPCESYVYLDSSKTVASEFELLCGIDKTSQLALATSATYLGSAIGSIFGGILADKYGRTSVLAIGYTLTSILTLSSSITKKFYVYVILKFFIGMTYIVGMIAGYIYTIEMLPAKQRAYSGFAMPVFYGTGNIILGVLGYYFQDWRTLLKIVFLFQTPVILFSLIVEKSPQYLCRVGKIDEAACILYKYVRHDKVGSDKVGSDRVGSEKIGSDKVGKTKKSGQEACSKSDIKDVLENVEQDQNEKLFTTIDLFRNKPKMAIVTLKVVGIFCLMNIYFFGISLNVGSLPGSIYFNISMNGVFGIASCIFAPLVNNPKLGRKNLSSILFLLSAISYTISTVYINSCEPLFQNVSQYSAFFGKLFIGGTFKVIYEHTADLFPTCLRGNAMGLANFASQIMGLFVPFILELGKIASWLPGVVISVSAVLGAILSQTLPETLGLSSLQTISDAENFYNEV